MMIAKSNECICNSTNPQSGSHSGSSGDNNMQVQRQNKPLPPLFFYMEAGDWSRALQRAKKHPKEVKAWATIRLKSDQQAASGTIISSSKRLALHQACFKLRHAVYAGNTSNQPDPFVEICKFILLVLEMYPEAAGMRESRHGCLPLHLVAFASCTLPSARSTAAKEEPPTIPHTLSAPQDLRFSMSTISTALPNALLSPLRGGGPGRPAVVLSHNRSTSESSNATVQTTMTAGLAAECAAGDQTDFLKLANARQTTNGKGHKRLSSTGTLDTAVEAGIHAMQPAAKPTMSVSLGNNVRISEKREEWAVRVLNALLDANPRGIRMDSEGGRLPLHTACAGRATPGVVSTLLTAYPAAARHRNKDGFLPLHLAAHWGISHPNVVIALLKSYPDATFGRNRWERTPLEEALCMAGENGRPHQAALVRALRKHPSYWTRPVEVFEQSLPRSRNKRIVDMDETLPSNENSMEELDAFGRDLLAEPRNERGKPATDLASMIRELNWEGVIDRLEINPSDAEQDLVVTTRGGFTSTTGFTPLHYACERRPPVEVIEALISACPRSVTTRAMPGGALPLHVAATWYASVGVVSSLIAADKNGCKTHDELGNLPLHSACFSGTSLQVFDVLLRAYPKAALVRNHQGSLPDEITKRLRHDERKTILALIGVCKEQVLAKRERKHRLHRSDGLMQTNGEAYLIPTNPQNGSEEQELMWV